MREKLKTYSIFAIGTLSFGVLLFVFVKYILPVTAPFLIAWVMAMATEEPAKKLASRIRVPQRVIRLVMSIFLTLFVFAAASLAVWQVATAIWNFLSRAGESGELEKLFDMLSSPGIPIIGDIMPEELGAKISEAISGAVTSILSSIAYGVTALASALPGVVLFLLVTVISLVYFAMDLERINGFVKSLLPDRGKMWLKRLRTVFFDVVRRYFRSYFFLMLITYAILLPGFLILRIERAPIVALFVSLVDILPIIGVGTVLVPWGVIQIILGNHFLGIGLLVVFVVNATVRQFAEPKIVGKSLNMHPILTLIFIYVGYALFGVPGLLVLPLIAVALGALLQKNHSSEVT